MKVKLLKSGTWCLNSSLKSMVCNEGDVVDLHPIDAIPIMEAGWGEPSKKMEQPKAPKVETKPDPRPMETKHTKESLEAIFEADGIKGLREIGDPLDVKGRSSEGLIEDILKAQG